jgi:hypothetical protein
MRRHGARRLSCPALPTLCLRLQARSSGSGGSGSSSEGAAAAAVGAPGPRTAAEAYWSDASACSSPAATALVPLLGSIFPGGEPPLRGRLACCLLLRGAAAGANGAPQAPRCWQSGSGPCGPPAALSPPAPVRSAGVAPLAERLRQLHLLPGTAPATARAGTQAQQQQERGQQQGGGSVRGSVVGGGGGAAGAGRLARPHTAPARQQAAGSTARLQQQQQQEPTPPSLAGGCAAAQGSVLAAAVLWERTTQRGGAGAPGLRQCLTYEELAARGR